MKKYIWLIADTHFNHNAIIDFESRPTNYQDLIIKNWINMVRPCDTIIHLGDVIFSRKSELYEILEHLPGYKILVRGNHDRDGAEWFMNKGFHFVCDEFKLRYRDYSLLFTHVPRRDFDQDYNIHGHLHSKIHRPEEGKFLDNNILISCELNKYKPIRLDLLINQITNV